MMTASYTKLMKKQVERDQYKYEFKRLFEDITSKNLFIFSQSNLLRRICYRIANNLWFQKIFLITVFISTCELAAETYLNLESPTTKRNLYIWN